METDRRKLIHKLTIAAENGHKNTEDHDAAVLASRILKYLTDRKNYDQYLRPKIGEKEHLGIVQVARDFESEIWLHRKLRYARRNNTWRDE